MKLSGVGSVWHLELAVVQVLLRTCTIEMTGDSGPCWSNQLYGDVKVQVSVIQKQSSINSNLTAAKSVHHSDLIQSSNVVLLMQHPFSPLQCHVTMAILEQDWVLN